MNFSKKSVSLSNFHLHLCSIYVAHTRVRAHTHMAPILVMHNTTLNQYLFPQNAKIKNYKTEGILKYHKSN